MTDDIFQKAERLAVSAVKNPLLIPAYQAATEAARALEGAPGWKGRTRMTQVEIIINHLKKTGSITQREAMLDYGVQSFHRRLTDVREAGYELYPEHKKHPVSGQEYTRYHLMQADRHG